MSLYTELLAAGVPLDNHESDLYLKATPEGVAILKRFPTERASARSFISNLDGELWIEVLFAYEPFWRRR